MSISSKRCGWLAACVLEEAHDSPDPLWLEAVGEMGRKWGQKAKASKYASKKEANKQMCLKGSLDR